MQRIVLFSLFVFAIPSWASDRYYHLSNDFSDLKQQLFFVLSSYHSPQNNQPNLITTHCESENCFRHESLGYKKARELLFGFLFLSGQSLDTYQLMTMYCQIPLTNKDLDPKDPLKPMNIPDHRVVNAEHTWPQSKFSKKFPADLQKSDLHILLPELSTVNSLRSNHPFGEVQIVTQSPCPGAALGKDSRGQTVFEPHNEVKGNVARALFYFSTRYRSDLDPAQEQTLRQWHLQDPVDRQELDHNEQVFLLQKNRNPYIDHPEWVSQISDF